MTPNCLDTLTIIPLNEIKNEGIPCAKEVIASVELSDEDKKNVRNFRSVSASFRCYLINSSNFRIIIVL